MLLHGFRRRLLDVGNVGIGLLRLGIRLMVLWIGLCVLVRLGLRRRGVCL